MIDVDPTQATTLEELAECLRQLHIRADKPTYRVLEQRTMHENGQLPGSRLKRVRLGRSTISDVLAARKFPGKAFLLTFVDACSVDLETDGRWEQAWDRLAIQYRPRFPSPVGEVDRLRQENEELRQQLAAQEPAADPGAPTGTSASDEALVKLHERLAPEVQLPGHPPARPEPDLGEDEAAERPGIAIPSQGTVYVPLVRRIAAGGSIMAEQYVEDVFSLPRQLVGEGPLFMLQVTGDSMIGAAIADGDRVVVLQQPSLVKNGNIVAAAIDGEATVKTFKHSNGHVWLIPHNPSYTEILGDEARILGRVVAVLRRV